MIDQPTLVYMYTTLQSLKRIYQNFKRVISEKYRFNFEVQHGWQIPFRLKRTNYEDYNKISFFTRKKYKTDIFKCQDFMITFFYILVTITVFFYINVLEDY